MSAAPYVTWALSIARSSADRSAVAGARTRGCSAARMTVPSEPSARLRAVSLAARLAASKRVGSTSVACMLAPPSITMTAWTTSSAWAT